MYSWKLIFGPADAQTSVRFHQNSSNRRYSWTLIFGPAHAHTNVRYPGQAHQQRQPQVQLEAYFRSCACANKCQISSKQFKPQIQLEAYLWSCACAYKCQISRSGPSAAPAAGTAGSLSSFLRMRIQISDFWQVGYVSTVPEGLVLS